MENSDTVPVNASVDFEGLNFKNRKKFKLTECGRSSSGRRVDAYENRRSESGLFESEWSQSGRF